MKSVGIVGAGPSGKAAARYLCQAGLPVTVYDREPEGGGLLRYGYPDARMPTGASRRDTQRLEALGVTFQFRTELGRDLTLSDLQSHHEAVLLAVGSTVPKRLGIPGEDLDNVYQAMWFLYQTRTGNPPTVGAEVIIIGGGDTSVDAATTALDLGAESVSIYYRGAMANIRAQEREVAMAQGAGVVFRERTTVSQIARVSDKLELTIHSSVGAVSQTADLVIIAIGQVVNRALYERLGLEVCADGTTTQTGVFAAGESVYGPSLLASAILDGRRAARQILDYLA